MKIATWNVNGIRARQDEVVAFAERERPDVLCLQEIKAAVDHIPKPVCALPGYWCYWHGTKGYSGVAVHVRQQWAPDRPTFVHPEFDHETRIAVADLVTDVGGALSVASVYVPNGGKDFPAKIRFLEAMRSYVAAARASGRTLIVCGDLNIARAETDVHPKERDPRIPGQRPEERVLLEEILAAGGLHDLGRELDPTNDALFTWWAPWRNLRQRNIGWRLDYVLASDRIAARAVSCPSYREIGTSDHAPVVAAFEAPPRARRNDRAVKPFIVVCDFDGTATVEDVTNIIWDTHLDYDWRATLIPPSREGKWSALEMIARGYEGVGAPADELLSLVRPQVRLREGWTDFVALCRDRRWPLEVLSHGLGFYIREILPPGVSITSFEGIHEHNSWRVALPAGMSLGPGEDFKTRVVADLRARHPGHATAYVGDGRLDFPAARRCNRVFAVRGSSLASYCRQASIPFVEFETFAEVAQGLLS